MPRNVTYSALTLRVKASGEANREAWFLTAEEGVLRATVFGGAKSRLRAQVAPFHEGRLLVYRDPVRDSRKVSDFDVHSYRAGLRELYERAMTADALAETALASHGSGGAWNDALALAGGVLDALAQADAALCSRLGVYFLWQWAALLGIRPDIAACAACGKTPEGGEPLLFLPASEALFCEGCTRANAENGGDFAGARETPAISVGGGARSWLAGIERIAPAALARVNLDGASLAQAKTLAKAILAGAFGRRLATWEHI